MSESSSTKVKMKWLGKRLCLVNSCRQGCNFYDCYHKCSVKKSKLFKGIRPMSVEGCCYNCPV